MADLSWELHDKHHEDGGVLYEWICDDLIPIGIALTVLHQKGRQKATWQIDQVIPDENMGYAIGSQLLAEGEAANPRAARRACGDWIRQRLAAVKMYTYGGDRVVDRA